MRIKKYIIAVVDDDEEDRNILAETFRTISESTAVLTFKSGRELLNSLKSKPYIPDLVVTDFYMPMLSGVELIAIVKGNLDTQSVPMVLLSTIKNETALGHIASYENVHYFIKPANLANYAKLVRDIMDTVFTN